MMGAAAGRAPGTIVPALSYTYYFLWSMMNVDRPLVAARVLSPSLLVRFVFSAFTQHPCNHKTRSLPSSSFSVNSEGFWWFCCYCWYLSCLIIWAYVRACFQTPQVPYRILLYMLTTRKNGHNGFVELVNNDGVIIHRHSLSSSPMRERNGINKKEAPREHMLC
jgi:hypothetical protein